MTKPTPRKMHYPSGLIHDEDSKWCPVCGCVPVEPQEPGIEQKTMRMMRQPKIEGRDHTENEYCIEKECVPVGLQITETLAASHSRAIPEAEPFDCHFSDIRPYLQHKRDCAKFRAKDDGPGLRLAFWDDKKPCTCGLAKLEEKYGRSK